MGGNDFSGRGRSNTVEVKKTPIEITNENYVEQAKKVIDNLVKGNGKILTTSKIRKLLAIISDMYT